MPQADKRVRAAHSKILACVLNVRKLEHWHHSPSARSEWLGRAPLECVEQHSTGASIRGGRATRAVALPGGRSASTCVSRRSARTRCSSSWPCARAACVRIPQALQRGRAGGWVGGWVGVGGALRMCTRVHACVRVLHAWLKHLLVAEDLDSAAASGQEELLAAEVPRLEGHRLWYVGDFGHIYIWGMYILWALGRPQRTPRPRLGIQAAPALLSAPEGRPEQAGGPLERRAAAWAAAGPGTLALLGAPFRSPRRRT